MMVGKLWASAAAGAIVAWALKLAIGSHNPALLALARFIPYAILSAILILLPYGLTYFAAAYALRVEECTDLVRRLRRFIP